MDKTDIEQIAVSTVQRRVNLTKYLSSYLSDNDKTPSWDGFIYIYNTEHKTKNNLRGRIATQIKGHNTADQSADEISFSVNVADLRNYLNDGGIFYFVVYLAENEDGTDYNTKVYYADLPPIDIMDILSACKTNQKDKTIKLKSLPLDRDLFSLCVLNCYENCKRQESFAGKELPSIEELDKRGALEGLQMFISGYGKDHHSISSLLKTNRYIYAKVKGSPIPQPLSGTISHIVLSREIPQPVTVDGELFYTSYIEVRTSDSITYHIGNSVTMSFSESDTKCNIRFHLSNCLRQRVKDRPFIIRAVERKHFLIGSTLYAIDETRVSLENAYSPEIQKQDLDFVKMLDLQGCHDDIDLSSLNQASIANLMRLTAATLRDEPISGLKEGLPPIAVLNIGKLRFAVGLTIDGDDTKAYHLTNAIDNNNIQFAIGDDTKKMPVPLCYIYKPEDYLNICNIKFEKFLPSFQDYISNEYIYGVANEVMLRMLSAHDLATGTRKEELYDTALELSKWLKAAPEQEWDYSISLINYLQIIKRKRKLTDAEENEIYELLSKHETRDEIKFGAHLLLGDEKQAIFYLNRLSPQAQEEIKSYPIYNLIHGSNLT